MIFGYFRLQDRFNLVTGYGTAISISIITGSLFLSIPKTSAGAFTRGGALFIAYVSKPSSFCPTNGDSLYLNLQSPVQLI